MQERLGLLYPDSKTVIREGDIVKVDGYEASVERILRKGTIESREYQCENTGGLLLTMPESGSTLIPFGNSCIIRKRSNESGQSGLFEC